MKRISAIDRKDILVGLAILAVLVAVVLFLRRQRQSASTPPTPTPISVIEERLEDTFNLTIPEGVEKTDLRDISGGDGSGLATRDTILANLVDPEPGLFYQAWLEKEGSLVSLGKMRLAKGGYLMDYDAGRYPGYNKVVVSLEKVFDNKIEKRVLEGSF